MSGHSKTVQNHSLDVHLQFYPGNHKIKLWFPGKNAHLNRNLESISQFSYLQKSPGLPTIILITSSVETNLTF